MKSEGGRQKQSCAGFLFWGMITTETELGNPTFTEPSHVRLFIRPSVPDTTTSSQLSSILDNLSSPLLREDAS